MSRGAPLPPYIKDQGEGAAGQEEGTPGRSPTPTGSRLPLFLVGVGGGKEGKERGGRKGGTAPSLSNSDKRGRGRAACPSRLSSSPLRPM